jgi:hypothetical protein
MRVIVIGAISSIVPDRTTRTKIHYLAAMAAAQFCTHGCGRLVFTAVCAILDGCFVADIA